MTSPIRSVESWADLEAELAAFPRGRTLLLIGGADFASADPAIVDAIKSFLVQLAGASEEVGAVVVDGGTDAGVMRWFADARARIPATFPLLGVAPRSAFDRATRTGAPISVAAGHTVVFAVPGDQFGDEMPWLFRIADHLGGQAAPTVLVNGGERAAKEARRRLADGHLVVAVAGSGRAADELATERGLPASGRLRVIPVAADQTTVAAALQEAWIE
jgi:hypothetical protein